MTKTLLATITLAIAPTTILAEDMPADSLQSLEMGEVEIMAVAKETPGMRLQPQSVTQLGNSEMRDRQVTSLKEATAIVPNLFIPNYGSRLTSAIYIRGIGSRVGSPAVGLYVDGIPYVDKSAFDFRFVDIERMDVLRGPQGTLYGSNTMGGLMRLYTKNPFNHQGTDLRGSFATGNLEGNLSLTHYHRVSERFAFSAGAYSEGARGFFKNDISKQRVDERQNYGGRLRGIYRPNSRLQLDAQLAYDFNNEGAYPYFYNGTVGNNVEPYPGLVGHITNNHDNTYRRSMLNAGLNIGYHADHWEMTSVTGFQHLDDRMFIDQDFIQPDIYTLCQKQHINTLTEEVSFRNTYHRRWKRVTGASFMYQTLDTDGPVNFMEDGVSSLIEANTNRIFSQIKEQYPKMPTTAMTMQDRQFEVSSDMQSPQLSAAIFHQSTVKLGEGSQWELGAGLRLEYNDRHLTYLSGTDLTYDFTVQMSPAMKFDYPNLNASPLRSGKLHDHDLMVLPKGSVQYNLSGSMGNVYASVSKGYRSGGYNIQMFSDIIQGDLRSAMMLGINEASKGMMERFVDMESMTQLVDAASTITYKPEYSWNYELGTHLNLLQGNMQIDGALFYSKIRDQQIARFAESGLGRMMVNAGSSHSYGAELALRYRPIEHLNLTACYGYTHATFRHYDGGNGQDYTGNFVPFVPMHTMSADAAYTWAVGRHHLTWGISTNGAGHLYWTENNAAQQHFYALLGSRLKLDVRQFSFTLWGKNLTQSRYNTFYFESASRAFTQHCTPLQVGFDFALHL